MSDCCPSQHINAGQDPRQESKVSMAEKDPEHSPVSKDDWPTSPLFDDGAFYDELYHDHEAFRRARLTCFTHSS